MMAAELFSAQWIPAAWLLPAPSLLPVRWLLACAGSLAIGMLVWLMLDGAARLRPALRTRRDVWLAGQCVAALAALLPFLPHSADMSITPQITLPHAPAPAHAPVSIAAAPHEVPATTASAPAADNTTVADIDDGEEHILPMLAALWLFIYAAGAAWATFKLLHARRLWRGLLASAERLSPQELQNHSAFTAKQLREIAQRGLTVMRTSAAISPMLAGVRHPRLLLPTHLDTLSREQQQMIVAHELHHWRARDPLCLALASILQTIFWFNPALRWMARQMEWALELRCDQHVLAGRPQQQRKQYAAALLRQWTAITPAGAAAFGGATVSARIRHMQQDGLPALGAATIWLVAAALTSILALGAMLQPALATPTTAAIAPALPTATTAVDPAPPGTWRAPVDKVRVTSFFGVIRSVLPTPHRGIDFGAAKGTPVHAAAGGTVIAAGPIAENDGRYGNVVIIDHGGQQSFYAHLDKVHVAAGQRVTAGQLIGAVGQTGFATGPHLHLELRENGRIIDPAPKFANLDAYATARALKVRRQQKG